MVPARELESGMLLKNAVEKSLSLKKKSKSAQNVTCSILKLLNNIFLGLEVQVLCKVKSLK